MSKEKNARVPGPRARRVSSWNTDVTNIRQKYPKNFDPLAHYDFTSVTDREVRLSMMDDALFNMLTSDMDYTIMNSIAAGIKYSDGVLDPPMFQLYVTFARYFFGPYMMTMSNDYRFAVTSMFVDVSFVTSTVPVDMSTADATEVLVYMALHTVYRGLKPSVALTNQQGFGTFVDLLKAGRFNDCSLFPLSWVRYYLEVPTRESPVVSRKDQRYMIEMFYQGVLDEIVKLHPRFDKRDNVREEWLAAFVHTEYVFFVNHVQRYRATEFFADVVHCLLKNVRFRPFIGMDPEVQSVNILGEFAYALLSAVFYQGGSNRAYRGYNFMSFAEVYHDIVVFGAKNKVTFDVNTAFPYIDELVMRGIRELCLDPMLTRSPQVNIYKQVFVHVTRMALLLSFGSIGMFEDIARCVKDDPFYLTPAGRATLDRIITKTGSPEFVKHPDAECVKSSIETIRKVYNDPQDLFSAADIKKHNKARYDRLVANGKIQPCNEPVIVPPTPSPQQSPHVSPSPPRVSSLPPPHNPPLLQLEDAPRDDDSQRKKVKIVTTPEETTASDAHDSRAVAISQITKSKRKTEKSTTREHRSRPGTSDKSKKKQAPGTPAPVPGASVPPPLSLRELYASPTAASATTNKKEASSAAAASAVPAASLPEVTTPTSSAIVPKQAPGAPARPLWSFYKGKQVDPTNFNDIGYLVFQRDPELIKKGEKDASYWVAVQMYEWKSRSIYSPFGCTSKVDIDMIFNQRYRWRLIDSLCETCKFNLFETYLQMERASTSSLALCRDAMEYARDMLSLYENKQKEACPECHAKEGFKGLVTVMRDACDYIRYMTIHAKEETADALKYVGASQELEF